MRINPPILYSTVRTATNPGEKPDRDEIVDSERANEFLSAEIESSQPPGDDNGSPTGNKGEVNAH